MNGLDEILFEGMTNNVSLYNYCPCVKVIWRFVHPSQVILPRVKLVEDEQIVILPSHKGNNCFIIYWIPIWQILEYVMQGNILQYYPALLPWQLMLTSDGVTRG